MKNILNNTTKTVTLLLFILMVFSACDKDAEIDSDFSFNLKVESETNGFILENSDFKISISPERVVEGVDYKFSYSIDSGIGNFIDLEDNLIIEDTEIDVKELVFKLNYKPESIGEHNIKINIEDNNQNVVSEVIKFEVKYLPYDFNVEPNVSTYLINTPRPLTINLNRKEGDKFIFKYLVTGGEGELFLNDELIKPGEDFSMPEGVTELNYLPSNTGDHTLITTVIAPDGFQKEVKTVLTASNVSFDFTASVQSNSIFKDQTTPINFNIVESSGDGGSYKMRFVVNSGNAIIRNANNVLLNTNVFYDVNAPGQFNWIFEGNNEGSINVSFFIKNETGNETEVKITVQVLQTQYEFSATPVNPLAAVNQAVQINFLTNNLGEEALTYTMTYSSDLSGNFVLNGTEYAPNVPIPIPQGAFNATFKGLSEGLANLSFTVTASNGLQKDDTIQIEYQNFTFNALFDAAALKIVNNPVLINIKIESLISDNYTLRYTESANSKITYNAVDYNQNQNINNITSTDFNITYTPFTKGNKNITLFLTSSAGVTKTKVINFNVVDTDITLTGYSLPNTMAPDTGGRRTWTTTFTVASDIPDGINFSFTQTLQDGCFGAVSISIKKGESGSDEPEQNLFVNPSKILEPNTQYTIIISASASSCSAPRPGIGRRVFNFKWDNGFDSDQKNHQINLFGPV